MAEVIENICLQVFDRIGKEVVEEGEFSDKVTQLPEKTNTDIVGDVRVPHVQPRKEPAGGDKVTEMAVKRKKELHKGRVTMTETKKGLVEGQETHVFVKAVMAVEDRVQTIEGRMEELIEKISKNQTIIQQNSQLLENDNIILTGVRPTKRQQQLDIDLCKDVYTKKQKENTWNDFLSNVTLHGFRYLFETKGMRRLIWIICFCISLASVILLFYNALGDYLQYKTYTVIEVENGVKSLDFPTLSMCHRYAVNKIKLKNFPFNITAREFGQLQYNTYMGQEIYIVSNRTSSKLLQMPYEEVVRSLDLMANDTILTGVARILNSYPGCRAKWCGGKDIIDVWSLDGVPCQQFNTYLPNVPSKSVSHETARYHFQIYLDTLASKSMHKLQHKQTPATLRIYPYGMSHHVLRGQQREILLQGVELRNGYVNIISLDYIQFNDLSPPHGRCGSKKFTLIKNYPYTKGTCLLDCRMQYAYKQCGCLRFDLKVFNTDIPICSTSQMLRCYKKALLNAHGSPCKCPPQCVQHEYNIGVERIPITLQPFILQEIERRLNWSSTQILNYVKENIVRIEVKYRKLQRISKNVTASVTLTSLLGTVGGSIGLGLGFSLLTLVEFIMFIYDYMFSPVIQRRQAKEST